MSGWKIFKGKGDFSNELTDLVEDHYHCRRCGWEGSDEDLQLELELSREGCLPRAAAGRNAWGRVRLHCPA